MSTTQKVILLARVGKDPDVRRLDNGGVVANFSAATNEKFKNKAGETVENTEWHNLVAWGKLAEIIEKYLKKGDLAYFEGKLQTRSYDKDGEKRYVTEIKVDAMQMIGGKSNGAATTGGANSTGGTDENLPF